MKLAGIVIAATALVILSGCSVATGTPSAPTTAGAGASSGATASPGGATTKTYSADDLVAILKKAQATLGVSGKISGDAQVKAELGKLGGGTLTSTLAKEGGTISPAVCATYLNNAVPNAKKLAGDGAVEAALTYNKGVLGVVSQSNGTLPSSITSSVLSNIANVYSACKTMKLSLSGLTVTLTITKLDVTTDAAQTYAFSESASVAGRKISTTSIEAVEGNLFIQTTAISGTQKDAVAAINAVVAAAK